MLKERWDEMTRAGRDWAVVTALTLTPLLLAVLRLFVFSRGDLETVTALLVNLNLVSFVASSMVAFMPYALLGTASWFALWPVINVENFAVGEACNTVTLRGRGRLIGVAGLTSLGLLFGSPWACVVVLATSLILTVAVLALRKEVLDTLARSDEPFDVREEAERLRSATLRSRRKALALLAYTSTAYAFVAVFFVFGIGYPAEMVRIKDEPGLSAGYVLSVDDVSLTLAYAKGGVRRVPNNGVQERILCPVSVNDLDVVLGRARTIAQILFDWIAPQGRYPPPAACTHTAGICAPGGSGTRMSRSPGCRRWTTCVRFPTSTRSGRRSSAIGC